MRFLVASVSWQWDRKGKPSGPMPGPYLDVRLENEVTAERLETYAQKVADAIGWRPTIVSIIDVRMTGPLPGDTKRLPCRSCLSSTHHQFVRDVIVPELGLGYEYGWQCLECGSKRERVLAHP